MVGVSFQALIADKQAGGGGGGYSFNMTAGTAFGVLIGYFPPTAGSIDAEPIPTNILTLCVSGGASGVSFDGDITALLGVKTVWVGGVQYATNFSGWSFDGSSTGGTWSSAGPVFVDGNSYFVEIK